MSRFTLKIIIILAALSIVGITITQVYWVRKAFDLKENQFHRDVHMALGNVAHRIFEINQTPTPDVNPVQQVSTNYFVVVIEGPINSSILEFLLTNEFEKRNIKTDFEYGIFDCIDKCMTGGHSISPQKNKSQVSLTELPAWKNDGYYFSVQFPHLEANLASQMGIWGFSSIVMLIVICFFVYTLMVILKQRRLSEIQTDFINNMTHEFKTPLSTIAISTEVLKDPGIIHTPERLLNYVSIIQNENNRLKQQVERVLQMARLEKSKVGLKKESSDLHELITEAVKSITLSLNEKQGSIDLELNGRPSFASVDKLHFINVIYNLLDNAIKYSAAPPSLSVRTAYQSGNISIEVTDQGIGLSPDHLKKIFHRFYRVPTGNLHDVKGFGLGLNYVKQIVEAHLGKITVNSIPGKGTSFKITLPAE